MSADDLFTALIYVKRSLPVCGRKEVSSRILMIVLAALAFLTFYRGYSVILFAPIAALGAVLLTGPSLVPPMFSSVFME